MLVETMVNWRNVHYLSYLLVLFFALEPSYIHPDEHFQSIEVLTKKLYGYSVNTPWEFQDTPSRSYAVLYLVYGPLLWINNHCLHLASLPLMYLARLQLALSYFAVSHVAFRVLCDTRQENSKSMFFLYTSYITWTYQSHTFSNSIETQLLLLVLALIHLLRRSKKRQPSLQASVAIGALISLGIFNRITFVAFIAFPSITLARRYLRSPLSLLALITSFVVTSFIFIYFDTKLFESQEYVITPLNNLLYNSSKEKLAQHGIHPRYTHLLINIPQIAGPALVPFFFRNHYKATIPYLSIFSGLFFLSLIPHQELRFLVPILPLICICIDFTNFERPDTSEFIMKLWCVFNLIFGVIMGSGHQRGVLEALNHLHMEGYEGSQIWWKTYSPPTWILGYSDLTVSKQVPDVYSGNLLIDLMGAENIDVIETVKTLGETILITPRSSVPLLDQINNTDITLEKIWSYEWHLDMDHFDFKDIRTFYPGIDIYRAVSLL